MSGIAGKVVAIKGASSGIGEGVALLLAGPGAKLLLGARGPDRLAALAARIAAAGGETAYAATDVRRRGTWLASSGWPVSGSASSTCWSATPASCRSRHSMSCASRTGMR